MKEITGIDHISITVQNMDESLQFYLEVIGCSLVHRRMIRGGATELSLMNLHGQFIELLQHQNDDEQSIECSSSGHIGFTVSDIYTAVEKLKGTNVEFIDQEPQVVDEGMVIFFFKGPSGETIELVQPPKK